MKKIVLTLAVFLTVTNTGELAGEEVVQLYIGDPVASISHPMKELKDSRDVQSALIN